MSTVSKPTRAVQPGDFARSTESIEASAEAPAQSSAPARSSTVDATGRAGDSDDVPSQPPQSPPARVFALRSLFWLMQIVAAAAAGYWWAGHHGQSEHKLKLNANPSRSLAGDEVPVTVEPIQQRSVERGIDVVGNLHGYDELTLKTKVSGRVLQVHRDFADQVAPGALLLEIDPTDALLAVEQAQRNLAAELAKWGLSDVPAADVDLTTLPTVVAARLRADLAKSQWQRLAALQNRGSVSAEEIDQARTNAMVAESEYSNQLQVARSGVATARAKKAELNTAEQQLRETKIYAPLTNTLGPQAHYTITQRLVTPGTWVAAGANLFELAIDETLKLRLNVPEKYADRVTVGQPVRVSTLAENDAGEGSITRVGPAIDPNSRSFLIEAEIANQSRRLKPGGFAKARIILSGDSAAQTVPIAALVTFAGVHKVFVVEQSQPAASQPPTVKEVQVTLGLQTDAWVEIATPSLPPESRVVTSGQTQLADGSIVRIREPAVLSDAGVAP